MGGVDLVEETFIVADPGLVADAVRDPALWRTTWADLTLSVHEDRGPAGLRWTVRGALHGSAEVWVQPVGDGALVHVYLRAQRAQGGPGGRRDAREVRRRALAVKRAMWGVKDALEAGRAPGEPPGPRRDDPQAGGSARRR